MSRPVRIWRGKDEYIRSDVVGDARPVERQGEDGEMAPDLTGWYARMGQRETEAFTWASENLDSPASKIIGDLLDELGALRVALRPTPDAGLRSP